MPWRVRLDLFVVVVVLLLLLLRSVAGSVEFGAFPPVHFFVVCVCVSFLLLLVLVLLLLVRCRVRLIRLVSVRLSRQTEAPFC